MSDRLPPLNALRAFEATARCHSMTAAAKEMYVTAGAVSRHIRTLEEHLGLSLFDRSRREITLTANGQAYFEVVTRSLRQIRECTGMMRRAGSRRALRVRAYTTFAMHWLIPRLSSFHSAHPDIEVLLSASLEPVDFDREELDAAVRLGNGHWHNLTAHKLVENILAPVCSPGLMHYKHVLLSVPDLAHHVLLHSAARERSNDWADWLEISGAPDKVDAYSGLKYENSAMAYQAARESQGIAMAQLCLIELDLATKRLVTPFKPRLDRGDFTYYLLTPNDRPKREPLLRFEAWILEQVRNTTAARALTVD